MGAKLISQCEFLFKCELSNVIEELAEVLTYLWLWRTIYNFSTHCKCSDLFLFREIFYCSFVSFGLVAECVDNGILRLYDPLETVVALLQRCYLG